MIIDRHFSDFSCKNGGRGFLVDDLEHLTCRREGVWPEWMCNDPKLRHLGFQFTKCFQQTSVTITKDNCLMMYDRKRYYRSILQWAIYPENSGYLVCCCREISPLVKRRWHFVASAIKCVEKIVFMQDRVTSHIALQVHSLLRYSYQKKYSLVSDFKTAWTTFSLDILPCDVCLCRNVNSNIYPEFVLDLACNMSSTKRWPHGTWHERTK